MKTTVEIGDRFGIPELQLIHEIIDVKDDTSKFICIEGGISGWIVGEGNSECWGIDWSSWKYLGNFNKVNHFEQLYNLFNE